MIVRYLDLKTGRKAEDKGITPWNLTEGNWSCDCNRILAFDDGDDEDSGMCEGCVRFIVYDVEAEPWESDFDREEVIRGANQDYYSALQI